MKKILTTLFAVVLFAAGSAHAAVGTLASWDNTGQPGTQVSTAGKGSAHISAGNMIRGAGLEGNAGSNSFNSKGWDGVRSDDYIQFGFTVDPGYKAQLSELWIGTLSSGTGPGKIGVYTSLDNYTTAIYTLEQPDSQYLNTKISLSGLGAVTGSFTIRLAQIEDTAAAGGVTGASGTFRVSNYYGSTDGDPTQITGDTSAVPIPAAAWLMGSGLVGLVRIRRRMR